MSALSRATVVSFIVEVLERRGGDSYLGENVTMLEHMLQTAALAEQAKAETVVVVAALLHDIGHYTSELGADAYIRDVDNLHEEAGALIVAPFFPALAADCIRYHVAAKRYLCARDAAYFQGLSEASKLSLRLQGGVMPPEETLAFESLPHFDAIVQVRRWDDGAKVPDHPTPPLAHYVPMMEAVLLP